MKKNSKRSSFMYIYISFNPKKIHSFTHSQCSSLLSLLSLPPPSPRRLRMPHLNLHLPPNPPKRLQPHRMMKKRHSLLLRPSTFFHRRIKRRRRRRRSKTLRPILHSPTSRASTIRLTRSKTFQSSITIRILHTFSSAGAVIRRLNPHPPIQIISIEEMIRKKMREKERKRKDLRKTPHYPS